jgi:serpin B
MLQKMGMTDAFNENNADFTDLGESTEGNIYISQVIHKTFIEVAEQGTRAGAVTAVEMDGNGGALTEIKKVYLTRPFLYMLVDCENNVPFFIGTFTGVSE